MKYQYEPIDFFFYRDKNNELQFTLNGSCFPNRKILMEMFSILNDILPISDKEIKERNLKIIKRQKKDSQKWLKENQSKKYKRKVREGYIYLIKSLDLYKIGRCISPDRIKTYRTENPHKIDLIFQAKVPDYIGIEKELLRKYSKKQYKGEWFRLNKKDIFDIQKFLS